MDPLQIKENYALIQKRIGDAAIRAGRDPSEVKLVAVTKTQPVDRIQAAIEAGATRFGENYADESVEKIEALSAYPSIQWHMIGHIQSRKSHLIVAHFTMVHSLDSLKLAHRLNAQCLEAGKRLPVLLEFNLASEESKSGWRVSDEKELAGLYGEIEPIVNLPGLRVCGLMTMPPLSLDYTDSRRYFRLLRAFREILSARFPSATWEELSMGTSGDYEAAIAEGATMVRIGQAIFGPRT